MNTQNTVVATSQPETQVTTFVQQVDAQGPVVVERISTQFADLTCSADNARKLVEALHTGSSVTLTADGKTATFTPTGNLGYGETYIALALAAEALRNAGVSGCATPEQWQAVLMGGPLQAAGSSSTSTTSVASSSSTSHFPGILALRSQGQGWGQVAQTTNVQLGQVMSSARSSLNIDANSDANLAPTGRSSAEFNRPATGATDTDDATKPHGKGHGQSKGKAKGHDRDRDQDNRGQDRDDETLRDQKHDDTPDGGSATTTSPRSNP